MHSFHILFGLLIAAYGITLIWQSRKGTLRGTQRFVQFVILGLFALAWVANTFGK